MKKRLMWIVMLVCLFVSGQGRAQTDSYTQALLGVFQVNPEYKQFPEKLMANFKPMFNELNKELLQDFSQSEQVIKQYTSQFQVDMLSVLFVPSMKAKVTEAELKIFAEKMSTPAGKLYMEHEKQLKQISVVTLMGEFSSLLEDEKAMEQLGEGKLNMKKVERKAEIPDEYVELFNAVYASSVYDKLVDEMGNAHPAFRGATGKQRELLLGFNEYMKNNMRTLILNSSYGVMTMDDWKLGAEISPIIQKFTDGISDVFRQLNNQENMKVRSMELVLKYIAWIQGQNIPFKQGSLE